jgi:exonuclease SbcD
VELTDPVRPLDPMRRLRERFPFALTLTWEPEGGASAPVSFPAVTTSVPDEDIIDGFLADCRGEGASDAERELIAAAVASLRASEVTA